MGSFLNDADGCDLTIKEFSTKVKFSTPSDALFTALIAKYTRASLTLFDDLLALFQHPAFDSNKVTLRYTEDAFTRIAEQRKLDAKVSRMERHQDNDSCA